MCLHPFILLKVRMQTKPHHRKGGQKGLRFHYPEGHESLGTLVLMVSDDRSSTLSAVLTLLEGQSNPKVGDCPDLQDLLSHKD